jgi:hypothetical protein
MALMCVSAHGRVCEGTVLLQTVFHVLEFIYVLLVGCLRVQVLEEVWIEPFCKVQYAYMVSGAQSVYEICDMDIILYSALLVPPVVIFAFSTQQL